MKIFLICPVRNATWEQLAAMATWINRAEALEGHKVYYPARDTDQNDPIGYRICADNRHALENADRVAVFFDKESQGSLFDLGMAFALRKPIEIVNKSEIEPTEGKSFTNMLLEWEARNEAD